MQLEFDFDPLFEVGCGDIINVDLHQHADERVQN
jgi:hypothetical protein